MTIALTICLTILIGSLLGSSVAFARDISRRLAPVPVFESRRFASSQAIRPTRVEKTAGLTTPRPVIRTNIVQLEIAEQDRAERPAEFASSGDQVIAFKSKRSTPAEAIRPRRVKKADAATTTRPAAVAAA